MKARNIAKPAGFRRAAAFRTAVLFSAALIAAVPAPAAPPEDGEMGIAEALRTALRDNPAAAAAAWGNAAALGRVGEARAGLLPQVSASAGFSRFEEPMTVTPIHRIGSFPPLDDRIYDIGLQVSVPVLSGRILAGIGAAEAASAEASAVVDRARIETLLRTAGVYIAAMEVDDRGRLLAAHIGTLEQRLRELEALAAEGRASEADLALAAAALEAARADEVELRQGGRELSFVLGVLLGRERGIRPKISGLRIEAVDAAGPEKQAEGPAARQARARKESAAYGEKAARRSLWPELSVFAGNTWRSGGDLDFASEWSAGLSLRFPVLDYARRAASIRAAEAGTAAAESRYREARISEASNAEILFSRMEGLRRREDFLERAVRGRETAVEAFRERYSEGRLSLSELLAGEAELLQLAIQRRSVIFRRASTFLEYHALRGTLTEKIILSIVEE